MDKRFDSHISEDGARAQSVAEHCKGTAELAQEFASHFGAAECGALAGMIHDIGKYLKEFQLHIHDPQHGHRTDHSTAGAQAAMKELKPPMPPVAFAVAGHHTGLPDGGTSLDTADSATFYGRMKKPVPDCSAWKQKLKLPHAEMPGFCRENGFSFVFFTRMLYSCLVDADFLDTENFMAEGIAPRGGGEELPVLLQKTRAKARSWLDAPQKSEVNQKRCEILTRCITSGKTSEPGLFTLTVPTGGSKTFSSLAFALEHAVKNRFRRVVYVIPYTSIIDQTAEVFSEILGEENVLAHYASAEFLLKDPENMTPQDYRRAAAAENWDAPVVVTTAVQFFESLYGSRSSQCRKLHNLAESVVIFDEAQTLPLPYLRPCVAAICELVRRYRVTAVLCTATQPELGGLFREFAPELSPREICPGTEELYRSFHRTELRDIGTIPTGELSEQLAEKKQVLCVVNRRKTAQTLFVGLPQEGSFCLTTLLTPADRKKQFDEIRARLKSGEHCRVVSTSLIEAGVDVDFPEAFREDAGLDSILQTAGRCNREGRRPVSESRVSVFALAESAVPPMLAQNAEAFRAAERLGGELDSPQTVAAYFRFLLDFRGPEALDRKNILGMLEKGTERGIRFPFATVSERFTFIDTPTRTVCLPLGEGKALCDRLRSGERTRTLLRALGRYSVTVYAAHFQALDRAGALEVLDEGLAILTDPERYSEQTGLSLDVESGQGYFM